MYLHVFTMYVFYDNRDDDLKSTNASATAYYCGFSLIFVDYFHGFNERMRQFVDNDLINTM